MRPTSRENHQHDPEPKRIEAEPLHRREDHWERQHQHRDGIEERAQHHIDEDDRPEDQPSADPRVVGRRHDFLRYLEVIEAKADDIGTDHDQEDERRDDHRSGEALDDAAPREPATGAADHRCRNRADSAGLGRHDEDSIDGSLTAVGEDNALRNRRGGVRVEERPNQHHPHEERRRARSAGPGVAAGRDRRDLAPRHLGSANSQPSGLGFAEI